MDVKWCDYLEIVERAKLGHKKGCDWNQVKTVLGEKFKINKDTLEEEVPRLRMKFNRYRMKQREKTESIALDEIVLRCEEVVVNDESYGPVTDEPLEGPAPKRRSFYIPFMDLKSDSQKLERTAAIYTAICQKAAEEEIDVAYLLGYLLKIQSNKKLKSLGDQVMKIAKNETEKTCEKTIPIDSALTIFYDCSLGRQASIPKY